MHSSARKGLLVWQIRMVIAAFILLLLSLELLKDLPIYGLVLGILTLALLAFFGLFYIPTYFKRYHFALQRDTILLRTGVFVRRVTVLPYERMIMMTKIETPLMAVFGICAAVITLPGGRLWIAALMQSEATRLSSLAGAEVRHETV
ncbi:MAG TPA: PH domain-containing protein [Clostridiales bacterium]|jgi:membrane protein YdbS with pleckstrin-like domain|nr:PH domain-containing protein [Clostridiales bacterium]